MNTIYTSSREEWRAWLSANFEKEKEVWFVFPMKAAGEEVLPYNDAVEEALCFGWIDGVIKNIDSTHRAQRFTPRRPNSQYSRPNIERLIWLDEQGLIHPSLREHVLGIINAPYVFPEDIVAAIEQDKKYGITIIILRRLTSVFVLHISMQHENGLKNFKDASIASSRKPVRTK